ncbi:AB-hydrolase YheT [Laetiporus sulphureus 93-53]|uniref:AB-hydrolase YheT n=1 Tax=Laetiporus sulphureus 93-53 TaxID=1314785 RepID=A0A165DWR2_9APHY|nr:AB-hydrolase YheT [Laetiporus sulphureus 93-53]KZT05786.1 AB-hydrolase YheT [Laetiporus sulphureus 93-53]
MGLLISLMYCIPRIFYGPVPARLVVKTKQGSRSTGPETLRTFIETRCPSILKEYRPAWWLFSGHLQVAQCVLGDFSQQDRMLYERRAVVQTLLRTVDGGTLALDFTLPETGLRYEEDTPVVVVLHGLAGDSQEPYVRAILAPACAPIYKGGLGYRGGSGVPLTSPRLYSAGYTDDLRMAIFYIRKRYPRARLIGLGLSAGANILVRYLAEEGAHSRLVAGLAIACPWNFAVSSDRLEDSWFHRHVYSATMGQSLQNIIRENASRLRTFTDHPISDALPKTLALRRPTMRQFDEHMMRFIGGPPPLFPMPSAAHYYTWASSDKLMGNIRVPVLAINAEDDPIVRAPLPTDVAGNGWVALVVTRRGGHMGWFESAGGGLQVSRWTTKPVMEWLLAVGEDLVPELRKERSLIEADGLLTEDGRPDIGCVEVDEQALS